MIIRTGQIYTTVGTGGVGIADGEILYDFEGKASFVVTQFAGYGFLNIDVRNNGTISDAVFYANNGTIKDRFMIAR